MTNTPGPDEFIKSRFKKIITDPIIVSYAIFVLSINSLFATSFLNGNYRGLESELSSVSEKNLPKLLDYSLIKIGKPIRETIYWLNNNIKEKN